MPSSAGCCAATTRSSRAAGAQTPRARCHALCEAARLRRVCAHTHTRAGVAAAHSSGPPRGGSDPAGRPPQFSGGLVFLGCVCISCDFSVGPPLWHPHTDTRAHCRDPFSNTHPHSLYCPLPPAHSSSLAFAASSFTHRHRQPPPHHLSASHRHTATHASPCRRPPSLLIPLFPHTVCAERRGTGASAPAAPSDPACPALRCLAWPCPFLACPSRVACVMHAFPPLSAQPPVPGGVRQTQSRECKPTLPKFSLHTLQCCLLLSVGKERSKGTR